MLEVHLGDKSYPDKTIDYGERFRKLDQYLNEKVHPLVTQGAAASDSAWLTDHGPDHIATVICRADELVFKGDTCILTPYECYLLLCAIHFHDTGNMFGRAAHEKKITDIMTQMPEALIGEDTAEHRMIRDIAQVHGGYVDSDETNRDTIGALSYPRHFATDTPRLHFLSAILRFADELSDDRTRTSRFIVGGAILKGSEAYHLYADRLRTVRIMADKSIALQFELDTQHVLEPCKKRDETIYLVDFIAERLLKLHREHLYCQTFMHPYVFVPHIDVDIKVCRDRYMKVIWESKYRLAPAGYPSWPTCLAEVCPNVGDLNGERLSNIIREKGGAP